MVCPAAGEGQAPETAAAPAEEGKRAAREPSEKVIERRAPGEKRPKLEAPALGGWREMAFEFLLTPMTHHLG